MSNVHISTTSVLKDRVSGDKHIVKHNLPVENSYSAITGIFPGITKSLSDMVESDSTIAYNSFYGNGEDLKNNYEIDNYIETVDLNNNDELKTIIEKIREFIKKNKKSLADEFGVEHPGALADLDTKQEDLPQTHKYEDFSDNDEAKDKMTNVNNLAEIVFEVLTNDKYVSKQTPPVTFDRTVVLSIAELNVLIPKYYNSFVYIVGQGFNVFSPPHGALNNISFYETFDRLLKETQQSLIFSFGNRDLMVKSFFESSDVKTMLSGFVKDSKKEENEGYYVGGLNGSQKQGNGIMRWNNKNVFEGTFANDAINEGNFIQFGISVTAPQKLIMKNATNGDATLDGVVGTFDSVSGVFTSSAAPTTAPTTVSTTVSTAAPTTAPTTTASSATIVAVPTPTP